MTGFVTLVGASECHADNGQGERSLLREQDNIVVSGDKKGQVAVWDHEKVHERTVHGQLHRALTNNLRFLGPLHDMTCASASSDGVLKVPAPPPAVLRQGMQPAVLARMQGPSAFRQPASVGQLPSMSVGVLFSTGI